MSKILFRRKNAVMTGFCVILAKNKFHKTRGAKCLFTPNFNFIESQRLNNKIIEANKIAQNYNITKQCFQHFEKRFNVSGRRRV